MVTKEEGQSDKKVSFTSGVCKKKMGTLSARNPEDVTAGDASGHSTLSAAAVFSSRGLG